MPSGPPALPAPDLPCRRWMRLHRCTRGGVLRPGYATLCRWLDSLPKPGKMRGTRDPSVALLRPSAGWTNAAPLRHSGRAVRFATSRPARQLVRSTTP
jgi:hypothetical protein